MSASVDEHSVKDYEKTVFGFWIYLLTDFVLFSVILATYFVLRNSTHGGPGAADLLPLGFTFWQAVVLLTGSLTAGLFENMAFRKNKGGTLLFLGVTFILGLLFLGMQLSSMGALIARGATWQASAFLSAYYTLLGTHALHIVIALLWTLVLTPLVFRFGLVPKSIQRFTCLRLFWQFLGVMWVAIFTIVYLLGVN